MIAPPLDAPWSRPGYYRVRLTIIKDPQGATFIASQFVPENNDRALASTRKRNQAEGPTRRLGIAIPAVIDDR